MPGWCPQGMQRLPASNHPKQSAKILQDDPAAEGELQHVGQDQQGVDAADQVLGHTQVEK